MLFYSLVIISWYLVIYSYAISTRKVCQQSSQFSHEICQLSEYVVIYDELLNLILLWV
jgi:hypothetical protein